jgi:hypothetical protein
LVFSWVGSDESWRSLSIEDNPHRHNIGYLAGRSFEITTYNILRAICGAHCRDHIMVLEMLSEVSLEPPPRVSRVSK